MFMDSVLKKIIEIEKEAQKITDESILAQENLLQEIESEREQLESKSKHQTVEKISQIQKAEEQDGEKLIAEQDANHKKQLASFRDEFSKNSPNWEKQLFERIILTSN